MLRDPSRGYPAVLVSEARRLRAEGLGSRRIAARLRERYEVPTLHHETVMRWVDPTYADRRLATETTRDLHRRSAAWKFRLGYPNLTDEYKAAFIYRLHAERLTVNAITKVCRVVFENPPSRHQITQLLKEEKCA